MAIRKRRHIVAWLLVLAILLSALNLAAAEDSCRYVSDAFTRAGAGQEGTISRIKAARACTDCALESVRGHGYGWLLGIRSQTKGKTLPRLGIRTLLLLALTAGLLLFAHQYLRVRQILPADAACASIILWFIHRKDGKK